ncbi:MAG: hypothetical protein ACLU38_11405 [Dysosmobacter sp.]
MCGAVTGAVMVLDLLTPADPADVIGSKSGLWDRPRSCKSGSRSGLTPCGARIFCKRSLSRTIPPPQPRLWGLLATVTL